MAVTPVVIGASATDARVTTLMEAQQTELTGRYDDASLTEPFDPDSSSGAGNVLLTVRDGPALIACGALKRWDAITAEIKRMYTLPEVRGQGHARRVLVGLIERGRAQGYGRLMLETGDRQPEVIALDGRLGFTRLPNFGYSAGSDSSLCFELVLSTHLTDRVTRVWAAEHASRR